MIIPPSSRRKSKYTARAPQTGERVATSAMIASLDAEGRETVAAPFGHALVDLAKTQDNIVGLSADLSKYTDLHIFAEAHPDRFYQMGMAEALLMSAAAGLAREGFVPFATTYAVFASRRAYDFIAMAIAEENLPVKICCALPGLSTGYGRANAYVAVHQFTRGDHRAYFAAFEEIVAAHAGRPHWGKMHTLDAAELSVLYPRHGDFVALRDGSV